MAKIKPKLSKKPKSQKSDWEIIDLPQAQLGKIQNPYKSGVSFPTEGTAVSKVYDPKGSVSNPIMLPEFTVEEKPSFGTKMARRAKTQPATGAVEDVPIFETLLLPANLPIQATSRLGKAATLAAEVLNPVGGIGLKNATEYLTTKTPLKDAYKINPWAFKPQEGMMYRGLGEEGFKDAMESGLLRPRQYNYPAKRNLSEIVNSPKQFTRTYFAPSEQFDVVRGYGSNYIAEVPKTSDFARRYGRQDWSWSTGRQIPLEEANLYKQDWLRGYKPINISKAEGGTISNWEIIPEAQSRRVIEDNMGQWKYPGEITKINSPNITMQGVNYPVLGVSDTNDVQMMYPNQDYKFKGSSVTEYPMMQPGGKTTRPPLEISDPREYAKRAQAYQDSLYAYTKGNEVLKNINNILTNYNKSDYSYATTDFIKNPLKKVDYGENKKGISPKGYGDYYEREALRTTGNDVPIDLQIAKELKKLNNLNILPFRTISSAELPDRFIYKKPVQPVIYKPELLEPKTAQLQSLPINQELNLIPFAKGTYYTRPRQRQEEGYGKLTDYYNREGIKIGTYEEGGELPEAGSGYKVIRSSERKGKTHKVIGPDGTVKFFGDSKLGQHPKDPARKKAFYARHAKNLKKNPYFRAFARKTWEEGGMLPDLMEMAAGGQFLTVGGEYHRIYKNADGDIMVNHPKEDKGKWDTINLTDKAGAKTVADGVAATKKWHKENPYAFGGRLPIAQDGFRAINDNPYVQVAKIFDPTGISSYPDVFYSGLDFYNNPSWSGAANVGINVLGALPMIGKLAMPAKLARAAAKTADKATGISKGVNAVIDTAPELIPFLRRPTEIVQDFTSKKFVQPFADAIKGGGKQYKAEKIKSINNNVDRINLTNNAADIYSTFKSRISDEKKAFGGNVILEKYQDGKAVNTLEGDLYSKILMNRNKDKDFVKRAYAVAQYPNTNMFQEFADFDTKQSHKMGWGEDESGQAYMFPTIMNSGNEAIPVPNMYADYISSQGYKNAAGIKYKNGGSTWEIVPDTEWEII